MVYLVIKSLNLYDYTFKYFIIRNEVKYWKGILFKSKSISLFWICFSYMSSMLWATIHSPHIRLKKDFSKNRIVTVRMKIILTTYAI